MLSFENQKLNVRSCYVHCKWKKCRLTYFITAFSFCFRLNFGFCWFFVYFEKWCVKRFMCSQFNLTFVLLFLFPFRYWRIKENFIRNTVSNVSLLFGKTGLQKNIFKISIFRLCNSNKIKIQKQCNLLKRFFAGSLNTFVNVKNFQFLSHEKKRKNMRKIVTFFCIFKKNTKSTVAYYVSIKCKKNMYH